MTSGSSPLARGLPAHSEDCIIACRIIPARAGFTSSSRFHRRSSSDHPRSRGVYDRRCSRPGVPQGSSPLARGLPRLGDGHQGGVRIIPARAGFTPWGPDEPGTSQDHPRSRGVYEALEARNRAVLGSSPLARGLPWTLVRRRSPTGIIPARAGFTACSPWSPGGGWDHPRSRGVYVDAGDGGVAGVGIIPARAGFTTSNTRRP